MPQETHAFEIGYETRTRGATLAATAYACRSLNGMTDVSRYISPTVLLTTKENLARDLSAVFTVSDLFNTQRDRTVIDTQTLSDQFERRQLGRTAFVSLSWKFGAGGKAKDPAFDYGAP